MTTLGNSADAGQLEDNRNPLIPPDEGRIPVAFPISQGAVIIDFCGPWEVFRSADLPGRRGEVFQTYTVAETLEPITASGGMKIVPNYTFQTAPAPKVVVIPAQADPTPAMLDWVRSVVLSSWGSDKPSGLGLIAANRILEQELGETGTPSAFLRPAWFMENLAYSLPAARSTGNYFSFYQPLERPYAMVATKDVGKIGAQTLLQDWQGNRVIEIAGPVLTPATTLLPPSER
jgi:hypothetical protein